jgi:putative chitinase
MTTPAHYRLAESEIGITEIRGPVHNPAIVEMFKDVGHAYIDNDEIAWCAAANGSWLERSGIPSTGKLNAKSYLQWGHESGTADDLSKCLPGDVVVQWRQSRQSWKGHVGLYARHTPKYIWIISGNQNNAVTMSRYPRSKVLSVRRHTPLAEPRDQRQFTPDFVRSLAPRGRNEFVDPLAPLLNKYLPKYGINTPRRIAMFMANILAETGGFSIMIENMSYTAERIVAVWPSRFANVAAARPYARNPEALANKVYARYGNVGHPGWGYRYRGRGYLQTTFVDGYLALENETGLKVVENPDLLLEPETALIAACLEWRNSGCNELADANKVKECRIKINGGTHGLDVVISYYAKILPLVQDFGFNKAVKATGAGAVGAGLGGATAGGWLGLGIFLAVVGAALGIVAYYLHRNRKNVREAIEEIKGLEGFLAEHILDLDLRNRLGWSGRRELPSVDEHLTPPAS